MAPEPPGLPPPGLPLGPDFENPPGRGPDRLPAPGLLLPPNAGLGFQPVPVLRSGRASSPRGLNPSPPSPRGVNGRFAGPEPRPAPELRPAPAPYDRPPSFPGLLLGRAPPARGLPLLVVKGRARLSSVRGGREGPALERPGAAGRPEPERSKRGFSKEGFSKRGLSKPGFAKRGFGGPDLSNLGFSKRGFGGPDLSKAGFSKRGLAEPDFSNLGLPKLGLPVRGRSNGGRPALDRAGLLLRVSGR